MDQKKNVSTQSQSNDVTRPPSQSLLDEQRSEDEGMGQPQQVGARASTSEISGSGNPRDGGSDVVSADELLSLERKYWQALKDNDLEAALALTDDPCIVTGAQGVMAVDREAYRKMFGPEMQTWKIKSFALEKPEVKRLGNDVAILAYKVHEEIEVEGKPMTLDANDTSTWVRRNGKWVCALHTEALAGDPFGRDRVGR